METGVELGQKTSQRIERSLKILGDNIYKNTEAMSKWFTQTFKNDIAAKEKQAESYNEAYKETETSWKKYTKKNGEFDENAIDSAHAAEILSNIEDGYDSLIDDILSKIETGKEYYGKVMEYWKTKISAVTE
jgi:capsule polysaccharide export protein KpsE/RkpR